MHRVQQYFGIIAEKYQKVTDANILIFLLLLKTLSKIFVMLRRKKKKRS